MKRSGTFHQNRAGDAGQTAVEWLGIAAVVVAIIAVVVNQSGVIGAFVASNHQTLACEAAQNCDEDIPSGTGHGVEPGSSTTSDGHNNGEEISGNDDNGVPEDDESIPGQFFEGLFYGDAADASSTTGGEIARTVGHIASGVLVVGDVRDAGIALHQIATTGEGWTDLGLSVVGIIPVVGDYLRGASTAASHVDEVMDVADGASDLLRAGDDVVVAGNNTVENAIRHGGDETADVGRAGVHSNLPLHLDNVTLDPDGVARINGNRARNGGYHGRVYDGPLWSDELAVKYPDGVRFTDEGFPDFSPYAVQTADSSMLSTAMNGKYSHDAKLADDAVDFLSIPGARVENGVRWIGDTRYVWHHVEDAETIILIPHDVHDAVKHTGGAAIIQGNQK